MQQDIWKYAILIVLSGVFGYALGFTFPAMLFAAIGIIAWQVYRLDVLFKWIERPYENPMPESSGQFYSLYRSLNRKNSKSAKRKRQLSAFLSQSRKAVGALPDAIILLDEYGKIEWANANANHVLGIRWPEDAGVRFSDKVTNNSHSRVLLCILCLTKIKC